MTSDVLVNAAFRSQRITGQQRYATEIADRLRGRPRFRELGPSGGWSGSSAREWLWVLARLPAAARGATVLSLTARAPLRARQVLVVHDLFVLTNPEWYSRAYVATHAPALRMQLAGARAVVAVSGPIAEEVRARFAGEIVVAPNAPSAAFTSATAEVGSALERLGLRRDRYLLAVGSLDPRKNLHALAAAYGSLTARQRARFPLAVVGGGASIYREGGIAWPEGVVRLGYVDDQTLGCLYAGARAVVFPSRAEGFGLPLVEAAGAGTRGLVVSDIPVFRWICGEGAVYVDPGSVASIAAGLRRAVDADLPPIGIERGRFDWDDSAAVVADVCERVAGAAG